MNTVTRQERGWVGHFIGGTNCKFRRNTLLSYGTIKIVISTVGLWEVEGVIEKMGMNRFFETMVFHSDPNDKRYNDADVIRQIAFNSPWSIAEMDADDKANEMHETVVDELTTRLLQGEVFE